MSEEKLNESIFYREENYAGRSKDGARRTSHCNGELEKDEGGKRGRERERERKRKIRRRRRSRRGERSEREIQG